ncbi:hypothetical protein G6F57_022567 [Rhizopus arrhizus]|nr:hypothetical protein G6F57_022567 [Rhizopus arrhizus]
MMEQATRLQADGARQFAHRRALVAVLAEEPACRQHQLAAAFGIRALFPRRGSFGLFHVRAQPLDDGRRRHAMADAHELQAELAFACLQPSQHLGHQPRAGRAQRMPAPRWRRPR